jgi:hypothetical protein
MTTTETPQVVTEAEQQLERLQDRAFELARAALAPATVVIAKAALNEAGIVRSRKNLSDALDKFSNEQITVRAKQELERTAKDAYETAIAEAEWELDSRFVVEGNKTLLITDEDELVDQADEETGEITPVPSGKKVRKAMTADERSKWKSLEARKHSAVKAAYSVLRRAEAETATARDALALADKRISACRADVEAATAVVNVFAHAITVKENQS